MSKALPILVLALVAIMGVWLGRDLGNAPPPTVPERTPPRQPAPTRPAAETFALLTKAKTEATRFDLETELEALPFDELGDLFANLAKADQDDKQINELLYIMMRRDGHATMALVGQHLHGIKRSHAYFRLIEQWGYIDPHATLAFIAGLTDDDDPGSHVHNATTGFLSEWAKRDPRAALEAWTALPEPKLANASSIPYSAECLARSASSNPEMREIALEMLIEQPVSDSRTNAIAGALATWAIDSPLEEIEAWLREQPLAGAAKNTAAVQAAIAAAQGGNAEAADWVRELIYENQESEVDRANHLDTFVEEWARDHPEAAAEWLTTLPPGRDTDWAIRGLLRQLEYIDPAATFQWTRQVSSSDRRAGWAREYWNNWRRDAPVAAEAFIPQLTVDEREWLKIGG